MAASRKTTREPEVIGVERCSNPWNRECLSTDIAVYISDGTDRVAICHDCWSAIAETDVEWGERHVFS